MHTLLQPLDFISTYFLIALYPKNNIYQGYGLLCNSWHISHYHTKAFSVTYANAKVLVKVLKCPWFA